MRTLPSGKGLKREVYGGNAVGVLVVTLRNDSVTLKPKGARKAAEVALTWTSIYYAACAKRGEVVIEDRRAARRKVAV